MREYGVGDRLLLAVKLLHYCSEVSVRVGRVESQQFSVDVGLRQRCVLSPLRFIVYMNWIDDNSRVDESITVVNYRIAFCRRFGTASIFSKGPSTCTYRFSAACDIKEIDPRIGEANAVLRELYRSVVTKRELSKHRKAVILLIGACSDPHLCS